MRGSALISFESTAMVILVGKKADAIVHGEQARDNYPAATNAAHDAEIFAGLRAAVTTASNRIALDYLTEAYGLEVVRDSLNEVVKNLLPNKTIQRVKRYLRREARKPVDMSVRQCIMHIYHINTKEIACCPPVYDRTQCLSDDEIIDILLWGTPKSWQQEMDRQGFDPLTKTLTEAVEFTEPIEMSEDFNSNKKVAAMMKKGNNKKKANGKGSLGADGSNHCMLHGNNNAHDTSECKTLMAQAKKLKGNNSAHQKGKGDNTSWKNKAKDETDDSKKELAALIKKVTQVIEQNGPNAIDP